MEKGLWALLHKYRPYTEMDVSISEELPGAVWQAGFFWETWEERKKKALFERNFKNIAWIQNSSSLLTDKEVNRFIEADKQSPSHESLRFRPFHLPRVTKNQDNTKFWKGRVKMGQVNVINGCGAQKLAHAFLYLWFAGLLLPRQVLFHGPVKQAIVIFTTKWRSYSGTYEKAISWPSGVSVGNIRDERITGKSELFFHTRSCLSLTRDLCNLPTTATATATSTSPHRAPAVARTRYSFHRNDLHFAP